MHRDKTPVFLLRLLAAASLFVGSVGCERSSEGRTSPDVFTLSNGTRIAVVHLPQSTNVTLFTFLPMGLAEDGPGQAQWSHLVEHLAIRSTFPEDLRQANAETGSDHLRLDFYGHTGNWKEGLSHIQRWLQGVPFTEASLALEKPRVAAECDATARNFATHKFALAAWSQGFRHHLNRVELKGDVQRAELREVQRYRDERLVVPSRATVCLVGGVDAKTFLGEAERRLAAIHSDAKPAAPLKPPGGNLDLTWDLDARHLVLAWPIPEFKDENHAALMAAAYTLTMRFQSDPTLEQATGPVLARTDLTTPEGDWFYISAALRPEAVFAEVEKILRAHVRRLGANPNEELATIGRELAFSLTRAADSVALPSPLPPGLTPAIMEANVNLPYCLNVHRYGSQRESLARHLSRLSTSRVSQALAKYLGDSSCSVCTIHPVETSKGK
jgi:predicted Zn-dependent peptidase